MKQIIMKSMLFVASFLFMGMGFAQTVSGTVSDAAGPLPGANVTVRGTNIGAITDIDGMYTLTGVPSDAVLVVSFVGFTTIEVPVNGRTSININMVEDASQLDEVVLIGYGTTTVRDATGAVSSVQAKDFNRGNIASPEELIQGKSAGVQITTASGEPGAGVALRIRGTTSVRSNNNPLFVVDGVPLAGDDTSAGGGDLGLGTSSARNPLNFLNPQDIESISILKDASATAIYGSRGANGVVIIQTKSGRGAIGGVWSYDGSVSIAAPANRFDLLNREEYLNAVEQFGGDRNAQDFGGDTDWQDEITRTSFSHNQNLSYMHNYGDGNVRVSLGYNDIQGVVVNSQMERITGRLNANHRLLDERLNLSLQATYSVVNDLAAPISNNAGFQGDLLGAAYIANPTWPANVDFTTPGNLMPLQLLEYSKDETNTNRILLNFSADYAILPELVGKVTVGYDRAISEKSSVLSGDITGITNGAPGNGRGFLNDRDATNRLMEATLNYEKQYENSKFSALIGYSFQDFQRNGTNVSGFGFNSTNLDQMIGDFRSGVNQLQGAIQGSYQQFGYSDDSFFVNRLFPDIVRGEDLTRPTGLGLRSIAADTYDNTDELQSFFTRVNYSIADKYLFTVTLRADGSSKFGPENKYGYFPSGAVAWKVDQEDFIGEDISTLKLRVGYGVTGNQDGLGYGNFTIRRRFGGFGIDNGGNINNSGVGQVGFTNPGLRWEETSQTNLGLDFGFFADRLTGSVDLYYKDTQDLLLAAENAQPTPVAQSFYNLDANVINKGVEFAVNYDIFREQDYTWNVGFNYAYNHNELTNFDGQIPTAQISGQGLTGAFAQLLAGGRPLFSYFLREFGGYDENGIALYPNGDEQTFVGKSALPNVNLGFSTSATYRNWDFSAFMAGQFGHYIYNNTANAFFTAGSINIGRNITQDVLTAGESPANAPDVSTRFLEKGDFLRMQNLTVGYTLPLTDDSFFQSVRVFGNGQNLFVITGYSGLDPEVNTPTPLNGIPTAGIDYTSFPRPRTFTFGVNVVF